MTATFTVEHGQVAVFIAVDHCSAECVGIHAALNGTRHEALEPIRQGVTESLSGVEKAAAAGLGDLSPRYPGHCELESSALRSTRRKTP